MMFRRTYEIGVRNQWTVGGLLLVGEGAVEQEGTFVSSVLS